MGKEAAAKGILLTLTGGTLWGFSGTCGQFLMQEKGLISDWLVPLRLLTAGSLLLLICFLKEGGRIFDIWNFGYEYVSVYLFYGNRSF